LKEFDDRKKIDRGPTHRSHTGHEAGLLEVPVPQYIQGIFSLTYRRPTGRSDHQIAIAIEKLHVLEWNPERLRSHCPQIVRREPLPARLTGEIKTGFIHQTGRLQSDPLPPIQTEASAEEDCATGGISPPLTFMQRVSFWIGRQKPAIVRTIEGEMSGGQADDPPPRLFEILCEETIS
jgi:hypothetical protein